MSWLSRLTPRARAGRGAVPQEATSCTADPETCLMVFENHWRQVSRVLEHSEPSRSTDDLIAVRNHTDQMLCLLAEERPPQGQDAGQAAGPILQLVERERVLERLVLWHLRHGPDLDSLAALLKLLEMLIGQSQQGSTNLLVFSLLVPFIHREGAVGQQARDALLLVMAASAANRAVARYIAHNSYFCPVLATGLSALYSSLPRKMEVRGDDWHALRREDWMGVSSLVVFMNSLEFCNAVVQVAHPMVRSQLLDYLHNGFLVPVVAPALYKSSVDEMIASTAYLDLFLRSVSETALLKTFLRFILLHRLDNDSILDTLLLRISSNSRLCMVSLSLFRTLLSFNCEDIMLQLVLRYLLPCSHVMLSQRRAIREADVYGKSADKFLSLIPECCRTAAVRDEDPAFRAKATHNASAESPAPARPSTPSRLAFFIRQQSGGAASGGSPTPTGLESPQSVAPDSPVHPPQCEILAWDSGYLDYLKDARRGIELCSWACRDWSAPYDGENPSPSTAPPPPPPPTYTPSMAMYPEHFSLQPGGGGQQRAGAAAAAARSEWSGSEHDSGEWDVTIEQNNCISLTPRSKKRSLQCEQLLPKPLPPHLCPAPLATSPPPPKNPAAAAAASSLHNGTVAPGEGCPGRDPELEAKKVKRNSDHEEFLDENANQNGCPAQGAGNARPPPNADPACAQHRGPTVESLIQELLEQSPAETRPPDDSNGEGISIEAFSRELKMLEERVTPPADAAETSPGDRDPEEKTARASQTAVCCPARPLAPAQVSCQPYTGPLLAVLLAKMENMPHNSLYVNILLTGTLAQLACYPQPLLRSFLLNTNMVFQPSVKSLIQVLGSVKNRIEAFAASHEDFPAMLRKAQQYLVARGKVDWSEPPGAVPPLRRSDSLVKSRKSSLSDLILRHTNSPTRTRSAAQMALAHVRVGGQTLHSALFGGAGGAGGGASNLEKQAEALRVKNAVYCAVVFCEFLKELAALAQEHAVALPFARTHAEE
ncbi:FHF complex subunit HOOK-interacting protein 1B isoform X2 [Vanacampus margaritifer]